MHTSFLIKLLIYLGDKEHVIYDNLDSNDYKSGNESILVHTPNPKVSNVDEEIDIEDLGIHHKL